MLIPGNEGSSQSLPVSAVLKHFSAFAALPASAALPWTIRPFSRIGLEAHAGAGGIGFDVATPLSRRFNIRAGSDFFGYSTTFQDQGANVATNLRMRRGHASLDWFPFGGRFRLSPLVVFAKNNQGKATALVPPGSTITLNGQDYISSFTDPLHGGGSVDFRKASPGFILGIGNVIPRTGKHLSILARITITLATHLSFPSFRSVLAMPLSSPGEDCEQSRV
jgi:hypothetical protein